MAVAVKKYNPGFLTDEQIIDSFCVRTAEFDSLVESLREIDASSSPHSLVIGPRGSGKTHLLLRVAAEVRRDPALIGLLPIVFAEESYEVATCGEFWLECLGRLAEQAPDEERANLRITYEDLRSVTDDQALADRCLGSLLDFADRHETRLLLLVENLNMLFADIGDPDVGWQLRQTLQTEPRFILYGSATSRFDEIDNPEHALYDLFRVITLRPLDTDECKTLWQAVAGKSSTTEAVRPLEILTGGNPRLLTIIARFGADRSFRDLMENLLDLVDEHTEYFKSHLESLPPQERRVYLALARLWKPSTTREVADLARLNTNACSALLRRLVQRGTVAIEGGTPRRQLYYLTERLYNIYYLLRRGKGTDRLVQALIDFMICLYSPSEIADVIESTIEDSYRLNVLPQIVGAQMAGALLNKAHSLQGMGKNDDAIALYDQVIQRFGPDHGPGNELQVGAALTSKSSLLIQLGRGHEAIVTCEEVVGQYRTGKEEFSAILSAYALWVKGIAIDAVGDPPKALDTFNHALAYIDTLEAPVPDFIIAGILHCKGLVFVRLNQLDKALAVFDEVLTQYGMASELQQTGTTAMVLISKALVLDQFGRTISLTELSFLLKSLAEHGSVRPGSTEALTPFVAAVEPAKALDLFHASPAAHLLLPLITALQQELGQNPQVAKEVAEVASDVRIRLDETRARRALTSVQNHAS